MAIFVARASQRFDPGSPWTLELLVRRQTGPVAGYSPASSWPPDARGIPGAAAANGRGTGRPGRGCPAAVAAGLVPEEFPDRGPLYRPRPAPGDPLPPGPPGATAAPDAATAHRLPGVHPGLPGLVQPRPAIGGQRADLRPRAVRRLPLGAVPRDPLLFILWTFTAASLLLWGRGVFCGWLCPFGALQELLNELARKLRVPQFQVPFAVHERLWAIKYIILLVLFGLSLESLALAEQAAEVEPFKTAITLGFDRQWWFVATPSRCWWSTCSPARSIAATSAGRGPGDPGQGAPVRLAAPCGMRQALPALCPRMRDPGDPSGRPHRGQRMPLLPRLPDDLPRPGQVPAAGEQAQEAREERAGGQRANTRGEPLTWLPFPDCP